MYISLKRIGDGKWAREQMLDIISHKKNADEI